MSESEVSKLKSILLKSSSKSKIKSPLKKLQNKCRSYLIREYGPNCNIKYKFSYQIIDNLLYSRFTHFVAVFKDKMITDFIDEFLKRFYKKRESNKKIPQYASFYINYQKYFCVPTFRVKFYNKKIHQQREKKAKCFYNEKFKDKESNASIENDLGIGAASMGDKPGQGKLYYKNKNNKYNKTFFNEEVKEILEKETINVSNSDNTLSLHESGSKLKNDSSYLLNTTSKEESLCNIMNGLYNKKLFDFNCYTKRTNKTLSQTIKYKNISINGDNINKNNNMKIILNKKNAYKNNNIRLILKKRVINIKNKNKNISNNYETSEFNTKKPDNFSTNIAAKLGIQNIKILLNNKEYEKSASNKKFIRKNGLWNILNEKEREKRENRHVKSQDNNIVKRMDNLLTFHKNKKQTRNISYVTLYRKKSLPNSRNNIRIKNIIRNNNINDFTKNSNISNDKIKNMKTNSYKPIRLSKSNININNLDIKNQNESLLNKIKNKVYDILQKKAQNREKMHFQRTGENSEKNYKNINYNSVKRTPNGLTIFYQNLNTNKDKKYMTNNHRRNNKKFDLKSNSNIFKSNKLSKSPSISEFVRCIRIQKNNQNNYNKHSRNYRTIEGKSNNIQNLNININNQINIRLNNINDIASESLNNKNIHHPKKLIPRNKNKNKSIDFNTNQNFVIKYGGNLPTFFAHNNNKRKKIRIFQNNNLLDTNNQNIGNKNNKRFTYYKEKSSNIINDKIIKQYYNQNLEKRI